MTRAEYDGERLRVLMAGLSMGEDEARKQLEREYPKSSAEVAEELNFRGFAATEWKTEMFCQQNRGLAPRVVGGSRAWGKQHIDDFAEVLESHGDLMPSAIYRAELGISWSEERAIRRRIEAEKEARDEQ
jgi:hypothetical protein